MNTSRVALLLVINFAITLALVRFCAVPVMFAVTYAAVSMSALLTLEE